MDELPVLGVLRTIAHLKIENLLKTFRFQQVVGSRNEVGKGFGVGCQRKVNCEDNTAEGSSEEQPLYP